MPHVRLDKMIRQVEAVRRVDEQLPIQALHVLFVVSQTPGITMQGIVDRTGLALSSVSRNLMALGEWHRAGKRGYGLVKTVEDPYERRRKIAFLTPKGIKLVRELMTLMDPEHPTSDWTPPTAEQHQERVYSSGRH